MEAEYYALLVNPNGISALGSSSQTSSTMHSYFHTVQTSLLPLMCRMREQDSLMDHPN